MTRAQENALKKVLRRSGWEKRGGHPDKTIGCICELLSAAGFRILIAKRQRHFSLSPDGYRSASTRYWRHPLGLVASLSTRYGAVAADNSFRFSVRVDDRRGGLL